MTSRGSFDEEFDATLLDEPAPRGARLVALALLARLVADRERLTARRDKEALHDFRVALRRLRSWLRALEPALTGSSARGSQRRLRRVAKASNAGRDAEVFLGWLRSARKRIPERNRTAARWLITRFDRQRREAEGSLGGLLERDFARATERLQVRLESYRVVAHVHDGVRDAPLATLLAQLVRGQARELRGRLALVRSPDDDGPAHRARIAGKRLRYLLEPVAAFLEGGTSLVQRLKRLQDALGDLHDAHVWLAMLGDMASVAAMQEGRRMARTPVSDATGSGAEGDRESDRYPSLAGFAILARLAQELALDAFRRLTREWGKRGSDRFLADLERACVAMEQRERQGMEIERKYLLSAVPDEMPRAQASHIEQGYVPGSVLVERLRMEEPEDGRRGAKRGAAGLRGRGRGRGIHFYRTVKSGRGIARIEMEEETSRAVFDTMWPLTEGKRVTKTRYRVPDGALTWEVDEFTNLGLVVAEIELPTTTTKVEFPPWLAPYVEREVTGEPEYLNVNLAR